MPADPTSLRTHRPWGWFESIATHQDSDRGDLLPHGRVPAVAAPEGDTAPAMEPYLVKRLWIHPGARISLQRHRHRCEHWVVVAGSGELECAGDQIEARPGSTLLIPTGAIHRATAGASGLLIIEVQRGDPLSEEDIERFADDYGRVVGSSGQPLNEGEAA